MRPVSDPTTEPTGGGLTPAVAILLIASATVSLIAVYTRPHAVDAPFQPAVISEFAATGFIGIDEIRGTVVDTPPIKVAFGVDPETAPWWELAAVPRLGESMARRIVEFREIRRDPLPADDPSDGARVFRRAEDLLQVPGIGRATLRRMRPFLRFPDENTHE